ncbi:type III pantothenate kinase [Aureispira anguillae]|uniref:Type III pantothenate kinase n=1 Tax=Aureispira anguillae TaxID=2864201 RepID=A0A915YKG0_9BACT|nr:type III pantothenate kinase [Aureispira anguillae]BDS14602.1 type III pantothenate kinase [Aureispira anguillae]
MNLCIDVGNTQVKFGLYNAKGELCSFFRNPELTVEFLQTILTDFEVKNAILSSVRVENEAAFAFLEERLDKVLSLSPDVLVPIESVYETPKTLGNDRLAVVVGATVLYPNEGVLVVDAGTCITYDFITASGVYMGGSILPGINMRFRALHELTAKLPLIEAETLDVFIGTSTKTSIQTGIMQGVLHELKGFRTQYGRQFGNIRLIVTGGDASYFESQLKNEIFAQPNLVLIGLNKILDYNIQ